MPRNTSLVWTLFIHSLNKYLLNVYFMPNSMPEARDKIKQFLSSRKLLNIWGGRPENGQFYYSLQFCND